MLGNGDSWKCFWEDKIFKQSAENKTIWHEYLNNKQTNSFAFLDKNQSLVRLLKKDGSKITLTATVALGIEKNLKSFFICEGTWQKAKCKLENI